MRAFGLLAGDFWKAVTGHRPAPPKEKRVLRRDVQEQEVQTPRGPVLLRRTTVDEVEVRKLN